MPPRKTKKKTTATWNKSDDAKLRNLFTEGAPRGLNPEALDAPSIKDAHARYWPLRTYSGTYAMYRRKAREFCLNTRLSGARTGK